MNIKALIAIVVVAFLALFGYNYYSSKKTEKQRLAMQAESDRIKAETASLKAKQEAPSVTPNKSAIPVAAPAGNNGSQSAGVDGSDASAAVQSGRLKLQDIDDRFKQISVQAANADKAALSPLIQKMQSIVSEARNLQIPSCLETARTHLITGIEHRIAFFTAAMNDPNPHYINTDLEIKMAEELTEYKRAAEKCQ